MTAQVQMRTDGFSYIEESASSQVYGVFDVTEVGASANNTFNGYRFEIERTAGANSNDLFSIGAEDIDGVTILGNTISVDGNIVATFSQVNGQAVLQFTSAGNITTEVVDRAVQTLRYVNSSDDVGPNDELTWKMTHSGQPSFTGTRDLMLIDINDAPLFLSSSVNTVVSFDDNSGPVSVFGDANLSFDEVETGQHISSIEILIYNYDMSTQGNDLLSVDGTDVSLYVTNNVGNSTFSLSNYDATFSINYHNDYARVVLSEIDSTADALAILNSLMFKRGDDAPKVEDITSGQPTFRITGAYDSGGTAFSGQNFTALSYVSQIEYPLDNLSPAASVSANSGTYVENSGDKRLFNVSNLTVGTGENDQRFTGLTMQINGAFDSDYHGSLRFGNRYAVTVELQEGTHSLGNTDSITLTRNANGFAVEVTGSWTETEFNNFLRDFYYVNTSETPIEETIEFTLLSISDNGGTFNNTDNTLDINVTTSLDISARDDYTRVTLRGNTVAVRDVDVAFNLFNTVNIDTVEEGHTITGFKLNTSGFTHFRNPAGLYLDGVHFNDSELNYGGVPVEIRLANTDFIMQRLSDQFVFSVVEGQSFTATQLEDLLKTMQFIQTDEINNAKNYSVSLVEVTDSGQDTQVRDYSYSYNSSRHANVIELSNSGSDNNRINHAVVNVVNNHPPFVDPQVPFYRVGPGTDITIADVDFNEPNNDLMEVVIGVTDDGTAYGTFNVDSSKLGGLPAPTVRDDGALVFSGVTHAQMDAIIASGALSITPRFGLTYAEAVERNRENTANAIPFITFTATDPYGKFFYSSLAMVIVEPDSQTQVTEIGNEDEVLNVDLSGSINGTDTFTFGETIDGAFMPATIESNGSIRFSNGVLSRTDGQSVHAASDGQFVFTPNANFFGEASVEFSTNNGLVNGVLDLIILPVNDAPTASLSVTESHVLVENDTRRSLFNTATLANIESAQASEGIEYIEFSVLGDLYRGVGHTLYIGPHVIDISAGSMTLRDGTDLTVSSSGNTTRIGFTGDWTLAEAQAFIRSAEIDITMLPQTTNRDYIFSLSALRDSGGRNNEGVDTGTDLLNAAVSTIYQINNSFNKLNERIDYTEDASPIFIQALNAPAVMPENNLYRALDNYHGGRLVVSSADPDVTLGLSAGAGYTFTDSAILLNGQQIATLSTSDSRIEFTLSSDNTTMTHARFVELMKRLTWVTSSQDPPAVSNITYEWYGESQVSETTTLVINIASVNDAPDATVLAINPTYIEGLDAVGVFAQVNLTTVETADRLSSLTLTVTGVDTPSDEVIVIDGVNIPLDSSTPMTGIGWEANVTFNNGVYSIKVTADNPMTEADFADLIESIKYLNNGTALESVATRDIRLASISENTSTKQINTPSNGFTTSTVTLRGTGSTYLENAAPVRMFDFGNITNHLPSSFAGVSFTVTINGGAEPEEQLSFVNSSGITLNDNHQVLLGNTVLGTLTDITNGFRIDFTNTNMGERQFYDVIKRIGYESTEDEPNGSVQVDWVLSTPGAMNLVCV